MDASSQGLKNPLTFEGQKDSVLNFETLCKKLSVLFTGLSCNSYK